MPEKYFVSRYFELTEKEMEEIYKIVKEKHEISFVKTTIPDFLDGVPLPNDEEFMLKVTDEFRKLLNKSKYKLLEQAIDNVIKNN